MSLTSSHQDLQAMSEIEDSDGILGRTRDAARTLQDVLQGCHDDDIANELSRQEIPTERWWSALSRVLEGLALMGRHVRRQVHSGNHSNEGVFDWIEVPLMSEM